MAVLAQALLPLIDEDESRAVAMAQREVDRFPALYQQAYGARMRAKLGLVGAQESDDALVGDLLTIMAEEGADFTGTFRALCDAPDDPSDVLARLGARGPEWLTRWRARIDAQGRPSNERLDAMRAANPSIIPRNHRMEAMIQSALEGDMAPFRAMVEALSNPFADAPRSGEGAQLALPPSPDEVVRATFCGT